VIRRFQDLLLRLLRVPPEPEPPYGAPGSVRLFQAGRGYFHWELLRWGFAQVGALWGLVIGFGMLPWVPDAMPGRDWMVYAERFAVAAYLVQLPFTLLAVRLDYAYRWYIVTDRSLRVREGIWRVSEKTMSFANIQNLAVQQGPLQRLLGISNLEVRTAGGGDSAKKGDADKRRESLHLAYFRGVDNAEEVKTVILGRLRNLRGAGLGDPEDAGEQGVVEVAPAGGEPALPAGPAPESNVLAAARELLAEARRLRAATG
jgi:membrane protein YdbS with pleckstrin-like domain